MTPNFLFLLNGYSSPTGKSYSGGDLHAVELINYLAQKNHSVTLLLTQAAQKSCYQEMIARPPAQFQYYPALPFEKKFYSHFPLLFFVLLYRLLITPFYFRHYQKIVATSYLFFDVLPLLFAGKKPTFVFIYHLIGLQPRSGGHGLITRFLERLSLAVIKFKQVKIIAGSPIIFTQLQKLHHFPAHQILKSGNGIHLANYRLAPQKKVYDLLFCGRLVATKGVLDFINLAQVLIHKLKLPLQMAIIGEGPQKKDAHALIKKYHLEKNFTLFGFVGESHKITLLHQSRLFILPSHEEGWSLITGEALACGVPVVAYALPDIVPIWGKNQGVTWVKPFCQKDFVAKTIALLKDLKLYRHHARAAHANIARYCWSRILPKETDFLLTY
jgi:glycosyltransferase involved in cell wall biosynthesis